MSSVYKGIITKNEKVARTVYEITVSLRTDLYFIPGQFVMVRIPHNDTIVPRAFSIASSACDTRTIVWYVKYFENGIASEFFKNCKVGDEISMSAPAGVMQLPDTAQVPIIFIATSTGLAPFLSLLNALAENKYQKPVELYFGCRHEEDIFAMEELKKFAIRLHDFSYHISLTQPTDSWQGLKGRITEHIKEKMCETHALYFLCGKKDMIIEVRDILLQKGVPAKNIKFEIFF